MKHKFLGLFILAGLALTGCVRHEVPYVPPIERAAVEYDWFSDFDTYIEGNVYNDGETFIDGIELEIRTYDEFGIIIDYHWQYVYTNAYPGESTYFSVILPVSYAWDVDVFINRID